MKRVRSKRRNDSLYSARMQGGPLDGLDVYTLGQPIVLVEDIIDNQRTVCYVRHAYQMSLKDDIPDAERLRYEYVGWLHKEEQDSRSLHPELN